MATLFLRGMGQRDIPYNAAKSIKDQIEHGTIKNEEWVSFGDFSCKAGSITGVLLDTETSDKGHNKAIEQEYYEDRMKILRQTPEQRAERLGWFKLFYKIMTGNETTPEIETKAKEIQLNFFKEHLFRLECDPVLFKELVGNKATYGNFFHLLERTIQIDREFEKYKLG